MLQGERFLKIEELVNQRGFMNVKEMADLMDVTEKTIRLDCEELDKQGRLLRVYGGAKSIQKKMVTAKDEMRISDRKENSEEKTAVAQEVAKMIPDGSCVFLDGGSSVAPIARYLQQKQLKIVTNSHIIAEQFESDTAELYMIGGRYIPKYGMVTGPLAIADLMNYNFDYGVYSCIGADVDRNLIYTTEMETMAVKNAAMGQSLKNYLVLDSSKLNIKGFCSLISLDSFEMVFCDRSKYSEQLMLPGNFSLVDVPQK